MAMAYRFNTVKIDTEVLNIISEVDEFKGAWRALGALAPDRLSMLRHIATVESIGSSTRIEGSKLTDAEVDKLLSGLSLKSFATRDEQEVAGYAVAMETVFSSWSVLNLSENHIKQLHRDLLQYSTKDERHRGEYKKVDNSVAAFDKEGKNVGLIFKTATAFETPQRMQELVHWTQNELNNHKLHPLLVIAVFVVTFLEIHPFQDGNGRLSRLLTTLLLLRSGYGYVPYSSLESIVEQSKSSYYIALRKTQQTIRGRTPDWLPWIKYFLKTLQQQKKQLERKIQREHKILGNLPELSMNIVEMARERGRITTEDIITALDVKRGTVKDHLRSLTKNGHLVKHGKGKGTWYSPATASAS